VSDYNVERAIELYFESGGIDLGPPPTNPPPPVPGNRTPSQHEIIEVDDLPDLEEEQRGTGPTIEDDEAFARRLMQEDVDLSAPAANASNNDGVRSPIRARNDILVYPDEDYDSPYPAYSPFPHRGRGMSCLGG
jgi:UBX domain-containing protein 7